MMIKALFGAAGIAASSIGLASAGGETNLYPFAGNFERGLNNKPGTPYYNKIIVRDRAHVQALTALSSASQDPGWKPDCVVLYHAVGKSEEDTLHLNLEGCRQRDVEVHPLRENKKPLGGNVNPSCISIVYIYTQNPWISGSLGYNMIDIKNLQLQFQRLKLDTSSNPALDYLIKNGIEGNFGHCKEDPRQPAETVTAGAEPSP